MPLPQNTFETYREQIRRMTLRMSWEQICSIGRDIFMPVMREHGQLDVDASQSTTIARQAEDILQTLFHQAKAGDPAAARVFLQEANKTRGMEEAGNVIINIVPYDVPDKFVVDIEGYEGDNDTSIADATEVSVRDIGG